MQKTIHEKMFQELNELTILDQAGHYAKDYARNALTRHVYPTDTAIAALEAFDEAMPEQTTDTADILDLLHNHGSPATVSQIGGRYFGLVNGGIVPAGLATRWLTDVWDQNVPLYVTSPIVSKLEEVTERWLIEILNLPATTVAGFVSGSSLAILSGLAAGRYRLYKNLGWDINRQGLIDAPRLRIVASAHTHATVVKAAALMGFGTDNIEWINVDDQGRVCAEDLPALDDRTLLILQAGNVNSGAFDEFTPIVAQANKAGSWVHIDGAFGLWAAASKQLKHLTQGIEGAQSFSVDGHKTLNTPYDNGIVLCSDKDALTHALQASGAYIVYGEQRDGMLYTPEMSRRARAVELWATLKFLGKQGVDQLVYGLHQRANEFAEKLTANSFHILNDVVFNQVLVGFDDERLVVPITKHIQDSGECWVGAGKWQDKAVIRISVCSWATTEDDIERSVDAFVAARDAVLNKNEGSTTKQALRE